MDTKAKAFLIIINISRYNWILLLPALVPSCSNICITMDTKAKAFLLIINISRYNWILLLPALVPSCSSVEPWLPTDLLTQPIVNPYTGKYKF